MQKNCFRAIFPRRAVTPYIHTLRDHIPKQMAYLKKLGYHLSMAGGESLELKGHLQNTDFFQHTNCDGAFNPLSAEEQMLELENLDLFFLKKELLQTPQETKKTMKVTVYRK